jgi:hypothetical protein
MPLPEVDPFNLAPYVKVQILDWLDRYLGPVSGA